METSVVANESSNPQLDCSHLRIRFRTIYPIDKWKNDGYFTEGDLLDIDCYWMQFEPTKPAAHFILAILYVIIFIVGCTSNAIVIYVLLSSRKLRTPANILLINLAVSDLMLIIMIPIFVYNSFLQGPAIGKIGCRAYGFLGGFAGTSSIITLAAIAVDRFLVISRPMDKKPTRTRACITIVLIWFYAALFAGMPLVGLGKYVPEGYLTSCSFDYLSNDMRTRVFIFIFFIGAWLYPLSVISFCYVAIVRAVYRVRLNVITADGSSTTGPKTVKRNRTDTSTDTNTTTRRTLRSVVNQPNLEVTIAKFVMGLVSTWMIAWTPYALVSLVGISGHQSLLTPSYSMLPALFAKTAACIDPFIYALNHPKIRNELFCRLYKSFYANRDSMTESMRPTYDWKNGRSVTFQPSQWRYSGPSSRRARSFPCKDGTSISSRDHRLVQRSPVDIDGSQMKTVRADEVSADSTQTVRKPVNVILLKYKSRNNSFSLPSMSSHQSDNINRISSL